MPDLHGFPGNNLLNHTAPRLQNPSSSNPHSQLPSFPVSVIQNREGSPTKSIFGTSPTGGSTVGVGRRSPIHDIQMDSIAEDSTEDSATPTEINAPVSIAMVVSNHHSPPSPHLSSIGAIRRASVGDRSAAAITGTLMMPQGQQQQSTSRPTTPSNLRTGDGDEPRRRRSGVISPALQEQIQASFQEPSQVQQPQQHQQQGEQLQLQTLLQNGRNHHHFQPAVSDSSQILASSKSNPMSRGLMSMLQSPLPNNPQLTAVATTMHAPQIAENGQLIHHMANQQSSSLVQGVPQMHTGFLYANALNHYNVAAFHTVMPAHALMQPNSPFRHPAFSHHHHQQQQPNPASNVQDVLSHVSSVLNHCGIQYHHSNGVFAIDHQGVRLHILVCHLASQQNAIQLQYVAGDASQYQTLCSHLYSRLTATTLAAQ